MMMMMMMMKRTSQNINHNIPIIDDRGQTRKG